MNSIRPSYIHEKFRLDNYPDNIRIFLESCKNRFSWLFWTHFKDMFVPDSTNVESIDDARIICLPEMHFNSLYHLRNAGIIHELYEKGDVILIEVPSSETENLPQNHQLANLTIENAMVRGWDLLSADQAIHDAKEPYYKITRGFFERIPHQMLSEEVAYANSMIDLSTASEVKKNEWRVLLEEITSGKGNIKQKAFLLRLFIQREAEDHGLLGKVLRATFFQRQKEMIRVATESLTENNRVFIIAGTNHLVSPFELSTENDHVLQQGVDHLKAFLQNYPYVTVTADC